MTSKKLHLVKVLQSHRLCSRRQGDKIIQNSKIWINGERRKPDRGIMFVDTNDVIEVEGLGRLRAVLNQPENTKLFACHKLKGELVTYSDPFGRPTLFQRLATMGLPDNLINVGRLDFNTSGLILLTNNGNLARNLCLPINRITRVYNVLIKTRDSKLDDIQITKLLRKSSMTVRNIKYQSLQIKLLKKTNKYRLLEVSVKEGKNREVRNILEAVGLNIRYMKRLTFGPFSVTGLAKGNVEEVFLPEHLESFLLPTQHKEIDLALPQLLEK